LRQIIELDKSIDHAVHFLLEKQLPWGEFCTYGSRKRDISGGRYVRSVFVTTFVLHALNSIQPSECVREAKNNAVDFLLENMEEPGIWRFYGKKSDMSPDLDDSCCVLAALLQNGVEMKTTMCDYFLKYQDSGTKAFYTWIGISPAGVNDIDGVVNANVAFFYGMKGRSELIPGAVEYLNHQAVTIESRNFAKWYDSPQAFAYAFSRACADGNVTALKKSQHHLVNYLIQSQDQNGSWGNALETGLAVVSLLNFGYRGSEVFNGIIRLVSDQNKEDGSWSRSSFFIGPLGYYGSEELTTSICLEAISKYKFLSMN
jgi:hypothetical protein